MSKWQVIEGDCLKVLPTLTERIDAVVTDPPYGIGADEAASKNQGKYGWKSYGNTQWDRSRPEKAIFDLLLGLHVPTIIWGGNYFTDYLPPSMGWMAWDKGQRDFTLADFEMAWTSESKASRCVVYPRGRAIMDGKVHPTQKPVWVMEQSILYLRRGMEKPIVTVVDPFCGSGSTGVACMQMGLDFIGIELNPTYAAIARRRIGEAANHLFAGGTA